MNSFSHVVLSIVFFRRKAKYMDPLKDLLDLIELFYLIAQHLCQNQELHGFHSPRLISCVYFLLHNVRFSLQLIGPVVLSCKVFSMSVWY